MENKNALYLKILANKLNEKIKNRPSESIVITGPHIHTEKPFHLTHRHNDGIETHYIRIMELDQFEAQHMTIVHNIHHLYGGVI
jgi:tRNA A22 N-methylase